MDANLLLAWHKYGGGRELLRQLHEQVGANVVSFPYGPMPPPPLGWFTKPIGSPDDFKGLHFRRLWQRILKLLDEQNPAEKERRLRRFSIDGTLLQSFEFQDKTGYSGKHRRVGVKASLVVDATGLPLSAVLARGNAHDLSLAVTAQ
jgi:hypothetical protein